MCSIHPHVWPNNLSWPITLTPVTVKIAAFSMASYPVRNAYITPFMMSKGEDEREGVNVRMNVRLRARVTHLSFAADDLDGLQLQ